MSSYAHSGRGITLMGCAETLQAAEEISAAQNQLLAQARHSGVPTQLSDLNVCVPTLLLPTSQGPNDFEHLGGV